MLSPGPSRHEVKESGALKGSIQRALSHTTAASHISSRPTQEDRFTLVSPVDGIGDGSESAFFGVFDGTAGHFASETVHRRLLPAIMATSHWQTYIKSTQGVMSALQDAEDRDSNSGSAAQVMPPAVDYNALKLAIKQGYKNADAELLKLCAAAKNNYSSTTAVTLLVCSGVLTFAHVGDSLAVIGRPHGKGLRGEYVMSYHAHKPDTPTERTRIVKCGGSVRYLHHMCSKAFIRGGDFVSRKAAGDKPMQLQYSRAFGGKDLKPFGLSCEPDVYQMPIQGISCVILASDGLWDFCNAQRAVEVAAAAHRNHLNPSEALLKYALQQQKQNGAHSDNVTVIATFLPGSHS